MPINNRRNNLFDFIRINIQPAKNLLPLLLIINSALIILLVNANLNVYIFILIIIVVIIFNAIFIKQQCFGFYSKFRQLDFLPRISRLICWNNHQRNTKPLMLNLLSIKTFANIVIIKYQIIDCIAHTHGERVSGQQHNSKKTHTQIILPYNLDNYFLNSFRSNIYTQAGAINQNIKNLTKQKTQFNHNNIIMFKKLLIISKWNYLDQYNI